MLQERSQNITRWCLQYFPHTMQRVVQDGVLEVAHNNQC